MRRFCYFIVLIFVYFVNARPAVVSGGLDQLDSAASLEWNQLQPLEDQLPQEYRNPESEEIGNLLDERAPRLLSDGYNNAKVANFEQQFDRDDLQREQASELDDREKRSNSVDMQLDADIKRYEAILAETGKALERSALTEEERQSGDVESSNREKRSVSASDPSEGEANADESEVNINIQEEGSDNSENLSYETVAEDEEGKEEVDGPASNEALNEHTDDNIAGDSDEANAAKSKDDPSVDDAAEDDAAEDDTAEDGAAEDDAAEDGAAEDDAAEDDAAEDDAAEDDAAEDDVAEDDAAEDDASVEDAADDDPADNDAADNDRAKGDAVQDDAAQDDAAEEFAAEGVEADGGATEDDVEDEEDDSEDDSFEAVNKNEADLENSLTEVKSLDDLLEGLNKQTDELSQLRDELSSVLDAEYTPKDASRTRRQAVKRIGHENTVDYLKSLPQYKDVPRDVLNNVVQSLAQPSAEAKQPAAVEEIREPQPAERQAARVPKADMPTMPPALPPPATPCSVSSGSSKGPETKEEKELDRVIDMRKAEEAIVSKEQDEVIKAEHMAHTMQEDLHDVMREIRALKVEIKTERKDAEKVSLETKEAQNDLELHDERKYNARRKVDELYMRLTELESDTCDTRNKRKVLERFLDTEHYVLARRRRMLKDKEKAHHALVRAAVAVPSIARQSGGVQQSRKGDELSQVVMSQLPASDAQAVPRQAKPCESPTKSPAADAEAKKDAEYNSILQQIIIGEAQVKVEDVQVARAEEEAISLHKRLSNVLSKLAALSIEMKNLQTQAQLSGKRAKEAQAELAYHDQVLFTARKKVNAARNLESDLQRAISDQRMNVKSQCSTTYSPSNA